MVVDVDYLKECMSQVKTAELEEPAAMPKTTQMALVLEIMQRKTTIVEASPQFGLTPSEIESWGEDGERGMENALNAGP